jgi:hypothetical protein
MNKGYDKKRLAKKRIRKNYPASIAGKFNYNMVFLIIRSFCGLGFIKDFY